MKKRKIWIFPLPIAIAILFVLFGGGVLIYALTKTTEKAGPVGYWKLDEGAGTVAYDASGNSNTGTLTNFDFDDDSNWKTGKVAGALEFDGSNDYIDVGAVSALNIANQITIEHWVKTPASLSHYGETICNIPTNNTKYGGYRIYLNTDWKFYFQFSTDGLTWNGTVTSNAKSASTWYHIVAVYDKDAGSGNAKIYINGVSENPQTVTGAISYVETPFRFVFGVRSDIWTGGSTFTGLIDEVRIYNRALSAGEVAWNYNRGGPVGWWKLDEGSGTSVKDSSDNGNTGTWAGTGTTHWAEGKINGAGQFNGTDDYVSVGNNSSLNITGNLTIELWVNFTSLTNYQEFVGKFGGVDGADTSYELRKTSAAAGNTVQFCHGNGTSEPCVVSDGALSATATWYHVIITRSGTTIAFYINGTLSSSTTLAGTVPGTTGNAWIGRRNDGNYPFDGKIDDVRIYNYARSAAEVKMDYNFGYATKFGGSYDLSRGLVGYWAFEEGSGYTAKDSTTNANSGTLTNFDFDDDSNWKTGNTAANTGGALELDGTNDYVSVAHATSLNFERTDPFSIEAWIKKDSTGVSEKVIAKVAPWRGYMLLITTDNKLQLDLVSVLDTSDIRVTGSTALQTGTWYHLVATYDGSSQASGAKLYVNGAEETKTTNYDNLTTTIQNTSSLAIGQSGSQEYFNGKIDDVRIYNRALSADEIRYLYNRRGPVGWWKFDEGSGTAVKDSSFNANNGTWSGTGTHWAEGKINGAGQFNGTDDYVDAGSGTLDPAGVSFTIEAWVWGDSSSDVSNWIAAKGSSKYFHLRTSSYHPALVLWDGANTPQVQDNSTNLNDETWHHIVGVRNYGNTLYIYVDGIQKNSSNDTGGSISDAAASMYIGKYSSGENWKGKIDDVRIYNYARSAAEVKMDYNFGYAAKFGGSYDLSRGLVGHWKFEEGSGYQAKDSTLNANNGTLTNFDFDDDSNWTTGNSAANTGGALEFDGTNDYIDAGTNSSILPDTFTVSAWMKWDSTSSNYLLGWHTTNGYPSLGLDAEKPITYLGANNFRYFVASAGTTLTNGNWHHVVYTVPGSGQTDINNSAFYLDGVSQSVDSTTASGAQSSKTQLWIGKRATFNNFDGLIDDVRIYNRALSADEIQQLYNRRQPIAHWKFDEGAGTSAYDSSINGNTGTFGAGAAAPAWTEGKIGRALSFDGGDYVDCGAGSSLNLTKALTVEAWIKLNNFDDASHIVGKKQAAENYWHLLIRKDAWSNPRKVHWTSSVSGVDLIGSTTLSASQWYHIAGVYNNDGTANNMKIYINGNLDNQKTASGDLTSSSATKVYIGAFDGSSYFANGYIDDVRIYNYARTAAEIKTDYNAGMSTYFK